jgi:DNA-binding SARP family transcriptional activator
MALLSIFVLGPFQVEVSEEPVTNFATDKVRALLAYLALSPDRPHRRESLAGLLWPEFPERSARTNLRNALANLRRVICDGEAAPPFLHCTRQTIQFNGQSDYWLDADAFEDLVALLPPLSVQLEQAVSLVRGSFLQGFSLADAAPFEEWVLLRREHYSRQVVEALDRLTAIHEAQGTFELALAHAQRRVALEPWQEEGQRQLMRLLFRCGRRPEALARYETLCQDLAAELDVEPAAVTTQLYEQIRVGELDLRTQPRAPGRHPGALPRLPGFLKQETEAVDPPVFVARDRELAYLNTHLEEALAGHGHAIFVTGGPGRGKTALLNKFGRQATRANPALLVASGNCTAYSGIGDPYLPFRDVMAMLTGDVEARWLAGAVSTVQAHRLWSAFPWAVQSLLHHGPHVTGPLVAGQALLSRAALWSATAEDGPQSAAWLHHLRTRVEHRQSDPERTEQSHLFQQVTSLLQNLAETHPLLLILDDLQWADIASLSLLFHLGRRLEGARILIAGAYRADEVALGRPVVPERRRASADSTAKEQHPLEKVLSEFKRYYGDVLLDLTKPDISEQRHFVDALLETEPNHLREDFRKALARRTGGHPLFTVEVLQAMQTRGDLIRDSEGYWTEGPVLDWETLPVRVEGAIEARIGLLEPALRKILSVASVEGEILTAPVVAQVMGMEEGVLLERLAQDLAKRHRLVVEQAEWQIGPSRLSRFKFGHALVQKYLYQQLSTGERRRLHGKVAAALERWFGDQADEYAVQLAHHHSRAGENGRALHYFTRAAENAHRVYANVEACAHYTRAIRAARSAAADTESLIKLYLARGRACQALGDFEGALADFEAALGLRDSTGGGAFELLAWRAQTNLGRLWASRDYACAHDHYRNALEIAKRIGDPKAIAESLNWMGNWHSNQADPQASIAHHKEALEIFERAGDRRDLAATLDLLGIANLLVGDLSASVAYYDRAIPLFRELDDLPNLASSLTGRGHAGCSTYTLLTLVHPAAPINSRRDFEEATRITREIGSLAGEAWLHWSVGTLEIVQGRYGRALEVLQRGLDLSDQIEHREWIVGNRCVLGQLYLELLATEKVVEQLEPALILAEELGSRVWLRQAAGTLAAAHCLLDDGGQAQMVLEPVLSADTPMDTMSKRYCWARQAELALCQGDPALALDIVERLIASAPGMAPGRVITYLWKVKGEALAALGDPEAALPLLRAAIKNVRATGERFRLWRLQGSLGELYHMMGRGPDAEQAFTSARDSIQELADSLPDGALRDNFLQRAQARVSPSPQQSARLFK